MAHELAQKLSSAGTPDPEIMDIEQLDTTRTGECNLVIIACHTSPLLKEVYGNHKKLGFYAFFDENNLVALSGNGEQAHICSQSAGVIQATQNPWNPKGSGAGENVLWLISGTDENGIRAACQMLIKNTSALQYAYSAVIENDTVIRVPQ